MTIIFTDTPKLRQVDINFALQVILNILNPPAKTSSGSQNSTKSAMHHLSISEHGRCSSMSHNSHKHYIKYQGNELLIHTAYLGNVKQYGCPLEPNPPSGYSDQTSVYFDNCYTFL